MCAMAFSSTHVYENMIRSRLFEEAVTRLWNDGLISGEMHLSIGEEAIAAGTVLQLEKGDALALDHRPTAAMVMHGVDLKDMLLEFLGHEKGLGAGQAGHMHLLSKNHMAVSSGIVGASAPAGAGFALAARYLRPGKVALSFFGEGAMNQGMLLESLNLSKVWNLPLIFVCKDSKWSITTLSNSVTSGDLTDRAKSFALTVYKVDGRNVQSVWDAAQKAIHRARNGDGPSFIYATCMRREGHFLGDPLHRTVRNPLQELSKMAGPLLKSISKKKGTHIGDRLSSIKQVTSTLTKTLNEQKFSEHDPLVVAAKQLDMRKQEIESLRVKHAREIEQVVQDALVKISQKP
jgi:pyruvate dehydrogenase E1 component alpha subunit